VLLPQEPSTLSAPLRPRPSGPTYRAGDRIAFADTHRATTRSSRRRPPLLRRSFPWTRPERCFRRRPWRSCNHHDTASSRTPWPSPGRTQERRIHSYAALPGLAGYRTISWAYVCLLRSQPSPNSRHWNSSTAVLSSYTQSVLPMAEWLCTGPVHPRRTLTRDCAHFITRSTSARLVLSSHAGPASLLLRSSSWSRPTQDDRLV